MKTGKIKKKKKCEQAAPKPEKSKQIEETLQGATDESIAMQIKRK